MPHPDAYEPTTERLDLDDCSGSPGSHANYLFHLASYDFAARRLDPGSRVLDFGCGTGYGDRHLAEAGHTVVGIDISRGAVELAASRYASSSVEFQVVPPVEDAPLPFADGSFDAVVSFQVIEHVPSVDAYLAEIVRVLRPGGTYVCATPDRATRLFPRQRPWNRWHVDEFTQDGLAALVRPHLRVDEVLGMTAPREVVALELRRSRMLKTVTLPFTFPGAPERWRLAGLEGLRRASGGIGSLRRRRRSRRTETTTPPRSFSFGLDDIVIARGVEPSTNIVLVATKA